MDSSVLIDIMTIHWIVMPSWSTSSKALSESATADRNPSRPPMRPQKKGSRSRDITIVSTPWKQSFHTAATMPPAMP